MLLVRRRADLRYGRRTMGDSLIINSSPTEVRVALLENGVPNVFAEVGALYGQVLRDYRRV